jgi:O-methyltransferase domain
MHLSRCPPAATYLLRRVLYGQDDDHAVTILRNCRTAMNRRSRLLVIEHVLDVVLPFGEDGNHPISRNSVTGCLTENITDRQI